MSQAHIVSARGNQPLIDPMVTEVAFQGLLCSFVKAHGIVRASVKAAPATAASILVQHHDSVISLRYGLFRAGVNTGGLIAMTANYWTVEILEGAPNPSGTFVAHMNKLHPMAVLLTARDLTGFASPT
jgi:hypothetical protein